MPILTQPPEPVDAPVPEPGPDYAGQAMTRMADVLATLTAEEWAALPERVHDAASALQVALAAR